MSFIRCVVMLAVVLVMWECGATKVEVGGAGKVGSSDGQVDTPQQDNPPTAETNDSVSPVTNEPEDMGLANSKVTPEDSHQDHSTEHKALDVSAAKLKVYAEGEELRGQPGAPSLIDSEQGQRDEGGAAPVETTKSVAALQDSDTAHPHRESRPGSQPKVLIVRPEDSTQQSHGDGIIRPGAEHQVPSMDIASHANTGKKKTPTEVIQLPPKTGAKGGGPTKRRNINNEDDGLSAQRPIVPDPRPDISSFTKQQGSQGNTGSHDTQADVAGGMSKSESLVTALREVLPNSKTVDQVQRFAKESAPAKTIKEPSLAIAVPPVGNTRDTQTPSKALHARTKSVSDDQQKQVLSITTTGDVDMTTTTEMAEDLPSPLNPKVPSTQPIQPLHNMSYALPLHQSVDKTDGSLCSSSLFALAALATLAVAAAAPAH